METNKNYLNIKHVYINQVSMASLFISLAKQNLKQTNVKGW